MKKHGKKSQSKLTIDFTKKTKQDYFSILNKSLRVKEVTIIDNIYFLKSKKNQTGTKIHKIKDHINLSGISPLSGPQFIALGELYLSKKGLIIAGLKHGVKPNNKEIKKLLQIGVDAYCYNLVPAAIFAKSLDLKVNALGISQ